MSTESYWQEVEEDLYWRDSEIRFFRNRVADASGRDREYHLCRAAIVLLYAHLEGYCQFVFLLYVRAINALRPRVEEVTAPIAAACLSPALDALRHPQRKSPHFRRSLPNDEALHRFARDREFVETLSDFLQRTVHIPDAVITETNGNLRPVVLRKQLYLLGMDTDFIEEIAPSLHRIVNVRNTIAHGGNHSGPRLAELEEAHADARLVMRTIRREVMESLENLHFLKHPRPG